MLAKINGNNSVSAICPECKKVITVDPSEKVVFCEFCNKPFNVTDAINLHTEYTERGKAAKKPSDEAIAKFNAILEQNYKLAKTYLEDIINKEYPPECAKHLFGFVPMESLSEVENSIGTIQKSLQNCYSVNPYIGKMYYAIFCRHINYLYTEEKGCTFSGELAFLKVRLRDIDGDLNAIVEKHGFHREEYWDKIVSNFDENNRLFEQEYDDAYVNSLINTIWHFQFERTPLEPFDSIKTETISCMDFLKSKGRDVNVARSRLENFYSPATKEKIEKQRKAELEAYSKRMEKMKKKEEAEREAERLEKERKCKEAFDKEVAFWREYIDLLKASKAKEAFVLLGTRPSNTLAYRSEFTKFKKTLFAIEYCDDVRQLDAEALARISKVNMGRA